MNVERPAWLAEARRHKYAIVIEKCPEGCPAFEMGARFMFQFEKHFGDCSSAGGPADTIESILARWARMKQEWERPATRIGDNGEIVPAKTFPLSERTVYFTDLTGSLSLDDFLTVGSQSEPRQLAMVLA